MVAEGPPPPPPPFLPPDQVTRKEFLSQQIKVEAFLFVAFVAFTTILALGRLRSRGNGFRKTVATYAFMGATYLVTYVPGLMNQSSHSVDLFMLWAAFLAYLAATANNSSCYTLGDNEDRRKRLVVDYLVPWPLIVVSLYKNLASAEILVPVALIFWIVLLKLRERSRALFCATKSSLGLAQTSKIIVDFMNHKIDYRKIIIDGGHDDHHITTSSSGTASTSHEYLVGVREVRKMLLEKQKDDIFDRRPCSSSKKEEEEAAEHRQLQSSPKADSSDDIFESEAIITDVRLTKCIGTLFADSEEGKKLDDTCLSFAMFWLLLAKVAGYKEVDAKLRAGLLHPADDHRKGENLMQRPGEGRGEDDELEARMFRLVELELEFLCEYLYTNCYAIYARGLWCKGRDLVVVLLFLWLALPLLVEYRAQDHDVLFVLLWGRVLDTGFTRFFIFIIIFLESAQVADFLISKWAKVTYICAYLEQEQLPDNCLRRLWKKVLAFACRFSCSSLFGIFFFNCCRKKKTGGGRSGCCKKTLAQYSVLGSYDAIPTLLWFQCWIGSYFDMPRMGQAKDTTTELSPDLKNAVVSCLQRHKPYFRNGKASLSLNLPNNPFIIENYVTGLKSQARVILVWHIATSLFENQEEAALRSPSARRTYKPPSGDFHVATSFSKYCAYLVAFAPKLLPDHVYIAQCEFDHLVVELQKVDKVAGGGGDSSSACQEDPDDPLQYSILGQGRQLHEKLTHILSGHSERWKTLAEFWTEMLLFLALSDHIDAVEAHANHLCIGGEFITHLWALLTHEGCSRQIEPPTYDAASPAQ